MRISASEFILFCNPPAENVRRLGAIVPEVELMVDGDAWDHGPDGWQAQAEEIKDCGVPLSVHPPAWDVNAAAPSGALREAAMWMNRKSAELCHAVGGTQVVFHPGYYDSESNFSRSRAQDHCFRALEDLVSVCRPLGLTVAFENIAGPAMALFTQEEYIHALDGFDPCVKFLLDLGHAHYNHWDIPAVIAAIAPRLCGFHIHDNDGTGDAHLPIGQGTIAWEPVFAEMRKLPDSVLYVLEYAANTPLSALEEGRDLLLGEVEGKRSTRPENRPA